MFSEFFMDQSHHHQCLFVYPAGFQSALLCVQDFIHEKWNKIQPQVNIAARPVLREVTPNLQGLKQAFPQQFLCGRKVSSAYSKWRPSKKKLKENMKFVKYGFLKFQGR